MRRTFRLVLTCALSTLWVLIPPSALHPPSYAHSSGSWLSLEPGLELGSFTSPARTAESPAIKILRIDPGKFRFRLLNASATHGGKIMGVKEWAVSHGLVAAINASMFQKDNLTSVSMMRTGDHVNNAWLSKDQTLLAFDPRDRSVPAVQIIDRECQNLGQLLKKYRTLIQSIRMVSCKKENVWAPQEKKWSIAAIGTDRRGRVLFIHSRFPRSTHDLIETLIHLPIRLQRAMYVEGGPTAQLYIRSGKHEFEFIGNFPAGANGNAHNPISWPVPNVVGIERVTAP